MYAVGAIRYDGFASGRVVLNVLIDDAFLLVVAVGMTFVILIGGIDLSVGSVVALSTMILATLIQPARLAAARRHPAGARGRGGARLRDGLPDVFFDIQPFIVTLAGMFLARGLCYTISTNSIPIEDPFYRRMATSAVSLPGGPVRHASVVSSAWCCSPSSCSSASSSPAAPRARALGRDDRSVLEKPPPRAAP
jgi:ribose/xylose/arabinose/galactoside ABC-type transport system permease subunit